jgi:hypothetical protein
MNKVSNWLHDRPKHYYPECVKMFGKPTFVTNVRHGRALWKTRGLFTQHLLIDEDVKHCVPRPHHDYFYSSVKFFVPKDKLCDVLKISGSLNYDGLKKELTARCGGIGANYATIYLAMLIVNGDVTIKKVKSQDMYPRMISGKILPYNQMAKKMMALKRKNNKNYKKQLDLDFATYAYDKCYKKTAKKNGGSRTRRKTVKLSNSRNEPCAKRDWTACCPHMPPNEKGQYAATNEDSILKYNNKRYVLHACCKMCSDAMNKLAKNKRKFDKIHRTKKLKGDRIMLANAKTRKYVQKLKLKRAD